MTIEGQRDSVKEKGKLTAVGVECFWRVIFLVVGVSTPSLFIPVKIFFMFHIFLRVFFIGGFPIMKSASYPTLVI